MTRLSQMTVRTVLTAAVCFMLLPLNAQQQVLRSSCFDGAHTLRHTRGLSTNGMAYTKYHWDAERTYRQLVLLVSFSDCDFTQADPQVFYDSLFNATGFNQMDGPGCVADYFRDQSEGAFNLQFDVYGPIRMPSKVKSNKTGQINGAATFGQVTARLSSVYPDIDYSAYDWDSDGEVEQVVIVYAGYAGNQAGLSGYIWPTTGSFSAVTTPDGYRISKYTASGELWTNNTSCGIGTICHEYSHCLGLPDIYPTSSAVSDVAIVDEWDVMDGGTFTNRGWCPPNYSPLERMLLGWHEPIELTKDTIITGLKPIAEGGTSYLIRQSDDEFYLLENRQQKGWDLGLPGQGLMVYHVTYDEYLWMSNTVNNVQDSPNYHLVAADGMTYTDWLNYIINSGMGNPYRNRTRMLNSMILSTAPYPWETVTSCQLAHNSISYITQHDDGSMSFIFHTKPSTGLAEVRTNVLDGRYTIYDLQGRRLSIQPSDIKHRRGLYIVNGRKVVVR